jgi:hypothetical protein
MMTAPQNNALKRTSSRFSLPARRLTQCSTGTPGATDLSAGDLR